MPTANVEVRHEVSVPVPPTGWKRCRIGRHTVVSFRKRDRMPKQEFLDNLRLARSLFFHPRVDPADSHLDSQALANTIARAAIWLTPKSVKGFDVNDFSELGPTRQSELRNAVKDFLAVAAAVPPTEPASMEQLNKARTAFGAIVSLLDPYLPAPREGETIEAALKKVQFPSWVVNWDYELGTDEEGAPIIWINLFADESTAPRKEFGRTASHLNRKIHDALAAAGNVRWPYIRMRTAVEHKTA